MPDPSSLSLFGSGLGEDGADVAFILGVLVGVGLSSTLPVGLWGVDGVEIGDFDESGAPMSELSEFDRAGMAKPARNSVLMTAIRPH